MRVNHLTIRNIEDLQPATGGNREFYPVPTGPRGVTGKLAMTAVGGLTLTHGTFRSDIHVSGTLSNEKLSLGVVLGAKRVRVFGKTTRPGDLVVVGAGRENDASYRSAIEYMVVNVDQERVVRTAEAEGWMIPPGALHGSDVFKLDDRSAARLVSWATAVAEQLRNSPQQALEPEADQSLAHEIVSEFTRALSGATPRRVVGDRPDAYLPKVVRRAEAWLTENPSRLPSISDIAAHFRVSERQLFRSFHSEVGMSPAKYLKHYRHTQARLELLAADPQETTVTRVANLWGFLELGRFSVEYRRLFGECPSQTLRTFVRAGSRAQPRHRSVL